MGVAAAHFNQGHCFAATSRPGPRSLSFAFGVPDCLTVAIQPLPSFGKWVDSRQRPR